MFARELDVVSMPILPVTVTSTSKTKKPKRSIIEATASASAQPFVTEVAIAAPAEALAEPSMDQATGIPSAATTKENMSSAPPASAIDTAGVEHMATVAETYNDTTKSAFEKTQKMGEEVVEFHKGNIEAMVASARAAAKASETLAQDAAEYSRKSFEHVTGVFKGFASAKSPTEFFQLQSDFFRASFDGAVSEASRNSEKMVKVMGEVFQPLSSRYAVAAEKIKVPAL